MEFLLIPNCPKSRELGQSTVPHWCLRAPSVLAMCVCERETRAGDREKPRETSGGAAKVGVKQVPWCAHLPTFCYEIMSWHHLFGGQRNHHCKHPQSLCGVGRGDAARGRGM